MEIHVTQPGETLSGIAGRFGADPRLLRELNGIPESGALAVGQTVVIRPVETFHIVQPGETLTAVARRYGLTLRQLYRRNYWLGGRPAVQAGQSLVIAYGDAPTARTHTNGYAYPFISAQLLDAELPYMSYLTPFTYGIDASGGLLPLNDASMLSQARALGTVPLMHLSTLTEADTFSSERAVMILTDSARRAALIEQIVSTITAKGYKGLDVDFEYIPGAQREAYASFITQLRQRLVPMGHPVGIYIWPSHGGGAAPQCAAGTGLCGNGDPTSEDLSGNPQLWL